MTESKSRPPDLKPGDKVQLKDFHGRWDFDLRVAQVYWTGIEPNQYWMVQVQMGEDKNASVWAPHHHFFKVEDKLALPKQSCLVCGGEHGNLPCPSMTITSVDPLAGLEDE